MSLLQALGLKATPGMLRPPSAEASATADATAPQGDCAARNAALKGRLESQLADWRRQYAKAAPAQAWLDDRIANCDGEEKAQWQAKKAELDKKAAESSRRIGQADDDIEALSDPRSTAATFNAILARQKSATTIDATTEVDHHDGEYEKKRTENKATRTTTSYADGKATSRTDESTSHIGAGSYRKTNASSKEVVTADGRRSVSDERSSTISKDGVTFDRKIRSETENDGETKSVDKGTSTRIGPDGASRTDTRKLTRADGSAEESSHTSALERGDGKLGAKDTGSRTAIDAAGNAQTSTSTTKGGLSADKDGVGAYAGREQAVERKGANGLTTGRVLGLNANITCNVKAKGTTPPTYDVSISIALGVSGSLSAKKAKEGTGGAGASVSASMVVSMTAGHVMGDTEAAAYVAALKSVSAGGGGGTQREFAIIHEGIANGWESARAMYLAATGNATDPNETAKMQAGDSIETGTRKKVGGGINADAKGVGVDVGYEVGHDESMKVTKGEDGKLTYDAAQGDSDKFSAGAKMSVGVVDGAVSFSHSNTTSSGYKIVVDPAAKGAAGMQAALSACKTQKDLDDFARTYPRSVQERTVGKGSADTESASIGIAGAKATFGYGNSVEADVTTDKDGKLLRTKVTGANQGGFGLSIGKLNIGSSAEEKAVAEIDKDGNATIDIGKTSKSTDAVKFLQAHVPGMGDKKDKADRTGALAQAAGGQEPPDTDTKDVLGTKVKGGDLAYLGQLACHDWSKWMDACTDPQMMADWKKAGAAIARAGGGQAAVADALTRFMGGGSVGRSEIVDNLMRPDGGVGSGSRYEFPESLAARRAEFEATVLADSETTLDAVAKGDDGAKKVAAAGAELIRVLDSLYASVSSAGGFSHRAVRAEMLGAISARKDKVAARLRVLAGGAADALSPKEQKDKYNELLTDCMQFKDTENDDFARLVALNKKRGQENEIGVLIKELRTLHALWSPTYDEMAALAQETRLGKDTYWKYKPDYPRFDRALVGAPGDATPASPETADKRKKAPVARAPSDPVGDADRNQARDRTKIAQDTEKALPVSKARAMAAGNRLAKKIREAINRGAVDKHNAGMAKLKLAQSDATHIKPGDVDDLNSYGLYALGNYDAASKLFEAGLAMYPAKVSA